MRASFFFVVRALNVVETKHARTVRVPEHRQARLYVCGEPLQLSLSGSVTPRARWRAMYRRQPVRRRYDFGAPFVGFVHWVLLRDLFSSAIGNGSMRFKQLQQSVPLI